jgi:DnaJ-class molecular chaperone
LNITFDPDKIGMVLCPLCDGKGITINPKRKCCPECGGFGFIREETEQDGNTSTNSD